MSRQCPFPVRSTDSRYGYRASSIPGLSLCLAVVAALTCFTGLGHAGGMVAAQEASFAAEIAAVGSSGKPAPSP